MEVISLRKEKTVNSTYFSWILAAYYAWVLNFPFILDAFHYIHKANNALTTFMLMGLVCLFLWCIFVSLFSLLSIKYIEKPVFIGLTMLTSILSYAYMYFQLAFDDFSPMVGVIEQTSFAEVMSLVNPLFVIWFIFTAIIPCYYIARLRLIHPPFWKEIGFKLLSLLVYPLFFFCLVLPCLRITQPMLRLSGLAARLPYQIFPNNFVENCFNHYKIKLTTNLPYKAIGLDAKMQKNYASDKPDLLVLVIGETARGMNYQLNGYAKNTNPYTIKQNVVSFPHVSSCGTATRVSVPCLFSNMSRVEFVDFVAAHRDNLLDILKRLGMDPVWVENNTTGGCQGICKRITTVDFGGQQDEVVIAELARQLEKKQGKDSVIVLHLNGSHGPDYYAKYPKQFARFTPYCEKNELRLCDKEALLNAYDNTILYTDYVLSQLIETLKKQQNRWNSVLLYTSDHGESMGEHGLYGHCAPYSIAPKEQTHVPLIVWMSDSFAVEKRVSINCLKDKAVHNDFSHDNIFHSVLGLLDVTTGLYQPSMDFFKSCRA